jgi:multidrug transporter EmrE-like cation transporter
MGVQHNSQGPWRCYSPAGRVATTHSLTHSRTHSIGRYAIPAALYTVSDNCAVMVLAKVDPATFSLIWNCKTAVVAVLMRCVLVRKPFTWSKWVGIGLLLLGPVLVELGAKKGSLNKVGSARSAAARE